MFKLPILKNRVLIIQSDNMSYSTVGALQRFLKHLGCAGVIALSSDAKVNVVSIDKAITYLQNLKEKQNG